GECMGTMTDLAGGQTCVDTTNMRAPIVVASSRDGIDRGGPSRSGSWPAPSPCTLTPRSPGQAPDRRPLYDEEGCVPGGAFVLGDPYVSDLGDNDAVPRQVAVVAPFTIDRYELTVGRYRAALAAGFVASDGDGPNENPGPLLSTFETTGCTWSGDAS